MRPLCPHGRQGGPAAIVVCGDTSLARSPGFWVQDCAAASENLLLAAHGMGLGGVWCGLFPDEALFRPIGTLLELPEHILPFSLLLIGHPEKPSRPAQRYDESRIHYEGW